MPCDKKCLGYGEYEGKCQEVAGTRWTPHWCLRCDELRRGTITKQFDALVKRHPQALEGGD